MSKWRGLLIEKFPQHKTSFNNKSTLAECLLELDIDKAIVDKDNNFIANIFEFCEWCLAQESYILQDTALAFFYKDIFRSHKNDWPYLFQWLKLETFNNIKWYIALKISEEDIKLAETTILRVKTY